VTSSPPVGAGPNPADVGQVPAAYSAFVVTRNGDAVDSGVMIRAFDELPGGDVVIRVDWSSVNYKDGMVLRPGNRVARASPLVPGVDLTGTVLSSQDPSVETGMQVLVHGYDLGVAHDGGFAGLARVPSGWVVPLPAGLSTRHAAIIGTAGFTAALSLHRLEQNGLAPGDGPVVVTGASGGVGSMAVLLFAARGYEVVASTGKTAEHDYLVGLGASEVVGREALVAAPGRTLAPERWAGAVDCVGGPALTAVLRSLRYGAAVAASGLTGGNTFESSVFPFIVRNASLIGVDTVRTPIAQRRRVWAEIATRFPMPALEAIVDSEVGLEGVAPALDAIQAGTVRGRILVAPNG